MGVTTSKLSTCWGGNPSPLSTVVTHPISLMGVGDVSISRAAGTMAHHLFKVVENFLFPLRIPDSPLHSASPFP